MCALSTLVPTGARVTMGTSPDHMKANSGPVDEKYSPHGAPSPSLSAPVGWHLNMEAVDSTELSANLTGSLTTVTVELAMGLTASDLTRVASATHFLPAVSVWKNWSSPSLTSQKFRPERLPSFLTFVP